MTVAIYARSGVSDHMEGQLRQLRTFASTRGWQVREYTDVGPSTSVSGRLGLVTMLLDAADRRLAAVISTSPDRFSRSPKLLASVLQEFSEAQVPVIFLSSSEDAHT